MELLPLLTCSLCSRVFCCLHHKLAHLKNTHSLTPRRCEKTILHEKKRNHLKQTWRTELNNLFRNNVNEKITKHDNKKLQTPTDSYALNVRKTYPCLENMSSSRNGSSDSPMPSTNETSANDTKDVMPSSSESDERKTLVTARKQREPKAETESVGPKATKNVSPKTAKNVSPKTAKKITPRITRNFNTRVTRNGSTKLAYDLIPKTRKNVSPRIKSGVSPRIKSGVSPRIKSGVSPQIKSGVSPRIKSGASPKNVSPRIKSDSSPKTRKSPRVTRNVSPRTKRDASPKTRKNVSPRATRNVSPRTKRDASPKTRKNVSPRATRNVSPRIKSDPSPKTRKNVSPKTKKRASPEPKRNEGFLSPNDIISPLERDKKSLAVFATSTPVNDQGAKDLPSQSTDVEPEESQNENDDMAPNDMLCADKVISPVERDPTIPPYDFSMGTPVTETKPSILMTNYGRDLQKYIFGFNKGRSPIKRKLSFYNYENENNDGLKEVLAPIKGRSPLKREQEDGASASDDPTEDISPANNGIMSTVANMIGNAFGFR